MSAELQIVITTCPDRELAQKIAQVLISEKLASCANLINIAESIYEWSGELQSEAEVLLSVKTSQQKIQDVKSRIIELHSYEVPMLIQLSGNSLNKAFSEWHQQQLRKSDA